jgi:hypothetical protein
MFNKTLFQMRKDDGVGEICQRGHLMEELDVGRTWKDRPKAIFPSNVAPPVPPIRRISIAKRLGMRTLEMQFQWRKTKGVAPRVHFASSADQWLLAILVEKPW